MGRRSPYAQKLYIIHNESHPQDIRAANQRLIDWQRGSPYVWQLEDMPQLRQSPLLFARKFNQTDKAVVKVVFNAYAPTHQQTA